jgi:hypothetical protein
VELTGASVYLPRACVNVLRVGWRLFVVGSFYLDVPVGAVALDLDLSARSFYVENRFLVIATGGSEGADGEQTGS